MVVNKARLFSMPVRLDERAFEAVFHEHYPRVYAILLRLTGEPYEADDLAAETFWRLWERPPAQTENLAGWLYRVASRLGYNALRGSQRRGRYEIKAGRDALESKPTGDPAQVVEQRQEQARVREILRHMPMRDVQILVLRHSGLSYKEISATLGITLSSVGTLLARAETRFETLYIRGDDHASTR